MKEEVASTSSLDASLQELFGIEVQVGLYFAVLKGIDSRCRRKPRTTMPGVTTLGQLQNRGASEQFLECARSQACAS